MFDILVQERASYDYYDKEHQFFLKSREFGLIFMDLHGFLGIICQKGQDNAHLEKQTGDFDVHEILRYTISGRHV